MCDTFDVSETADQLTVVLAARLVPRMSCTLQLLQLNQLKDMHCPWVREVVKVPLIETGSS